ncbi:MAG: DUF853 family protein [Oscillospiraceae bacterium]|nr:DUF853 family protein [Oscillospiraceae bacterium]
MYLNGSDSIYIGLAEGERVCLPLNMANRHGLISGASGTGKTVSMKVMAESFSDAGVPVFLCDIKGDVSGLVTPGEQNDGMEKRIDRFGVRDCFTYRSYPVTFWDVYGETGHPVRTAVSEMGPDLLARILGLTAAQQAALNVVFRIADDRGLILTDLKDLRAMVGYVNQHKADYTATYGNLATVTLNTIIRSLLPLETQGGDLFFGEPALDISDWIRTDPNGHGIINLLDCTRLSLNPVLYSTMLLWMMAELYEKLPEVGDPEKPRLVFFFDEAHMLFTDTPKILVQKIEQVVRLIRSKGVGIYFVTQSPSDIPGIVLAQLSNRIQHALRAYTPAEQKAVKAAASTMRQNPAFNAEDRISELGVGEALVSFLGRDGVPDIVRDTAVICPQSLMAPAAKEDIEVSIASDGMAKYDTAVDNRSAFEDLNYLAEVEAEKAALEAEKAKLEKEKAELEKQRKKEDAAARKKTERRIAQVERQIINTGFMILRRGLFGSRKK